MQIRILIILALTLLTLQSLSTLTFAEENAAASNPVFLKDESSAVSKPILLAKNTAKDRDTTLIANETTRLSDTTRLANNYSPTIIPKPKNIPGPEIKTEEEAIQNQIQKTFGEKILPRFALGTIGIVGATSLVFIVIGGVRFAMSYGNEEDVESAKKQVIWAVVGFVLALLSYTIVTIIINLDYEGNTSKKASVNQGAESGLEKAVEKAE